MNEPLDEQYLHWLYVQVESSVKLRRERSYWELFRQLYQKEFIWLVPNDDNRVDDGKNIRYDFLFENEIDDPDPNWMGLGCSMLEMLLGLSKRLAFEAEGEPRIWFWHLIETLNILCSDSEYNDVHRKMIDEILDRVIWRRYEPDGSGGLFPIREPAQDQRKVEIWYQMSAYILELEA